MNALRSAAFLASSALITAWFVTLGVRATVGAPDPTPQVSVGAVPPPPPSLPPLAIPGRDPFAADAIGSSASAAAARSASGAPGVATAAQLASTNVPDVAALGGAALNVGIMATIVSDGESYALVEDGSSVRVAHVGDPLDGSTIASITDKIVVLANGVRISLDEQRTSGNSVAPPAVVGAPILSPSPAPSASSDAQTPVPGSARGPIGPARRDLTRYGPITNGEATGLPQRVNASTTEISTFGHTVLTNPNGTPVQTPSQPQALPSGTLFPSVYPSPNVVPLGTVPTATMQPGGHP